MKRIVFIVAAFFAVILAGCSPAKDNYLKAIPDNPVAMLKVNVGNVLDDSEFLENPVIKPLISLSASQLPQSMLDLFNRILENPEISGLEFDRPAVLAVESVQPLKAVITLAVSDKKKLEEMLYCFSDNDVEITTVNGACFINTYSSEFAVVYDESKFVVALDEEGANVADYMNIESLRAVDNKKYSGFFSNDDDVALYVSGADVYDLIVNETFFAYEERHIDDIEFLKETSAVLTLNFENGYAELVANCDLPEEYKEKFGCYFVPSTKKHLKYVPANAFFVADMGGNTEAALETMSEEQKEQVDKMFSPLGLGVSHLASFNGDMTFAMFGPALNPQMVVMLDCNDSAVFNSIISVAEMFMPLKKVDENVYCLGNKSSETYNIAYLDNKILLLPASTFGMLKSDSKVEPLTSNILDNVLVSSMGNAVILDFDKLLSAVDEDEFIDFGWVTPVVSSFESAKLEIESPTKMSLRVTIKDKSTNVLKFFIYKIVELYMQIDN